MSSWLSKLRLYAARLFRTVLKVTMLGKTEKTYREKILEVACKVNTQNIFGQKDVQSKTSENLKFEILLENEKSFQKRKVLKSKTKL